MKRRTHITALTFGPSLPRYFLFFIFLFFIKSFNSQTSKIDSLLRSGSSFEETHQYDKALINYDEALAVSKLLKDTNRLQKCYINLGTVYYRKGNYPLALEFCNKSLRIAERNNDKPGIAFCYSMLGVIYNENGDQAGGINYLDKAIKIAKAINDQKLLANFYNKIGAVYFSSGNFENALTSYTTALKILEQINYTKGVSGNLGSIGVIYKQLGQYDKALEYINKQYMLAEVNKNKAELADALHTKGGIFVGLGKDKEALEYFKQSLLLAKEIGSAQALRYAYDGIVTAHYNMGNFKEAFDNYELFKLISDSIFNLEKNYQINEIKTKYETEKKETENRILSQQTQIQSLELSQSKNIIITLAVGSVVLCFIGILFFKQYSYKSETRTLQLQQSVLRAQMNPHFVFNSLNSIQRMFIEGKTDMANDLMADFSTLLRRILNNSSLPYINLKEEIETLKLYMDIEKVRCNECFNYQMVIDENIDQLNTKVPPLIFQPFVENAIWHGILPAKKTGHIVIEITTSVDLKQLLCSISDNGVGISKSKTSDHASKGIQITQARLGNEINFENLPDGGTKVKLTIALKR